MNTTNLLGLLVMFSSVLWTIPAVIAETGLVYPDRLWTYARPVDVAMDANKLKVFSAYVGGRGCVVRYGRMVHTWGDVKQRADVASAAKPFYSYFLFKAIETGKIAGVDNKVVAWEPRIGQINEHLGHKDRAITWRHMANQISCYQLTDAPGTAYAYNDWQLALFWDTLFKKVYGANYQDVDQKIFHPLLTDLIGCQDQPTFLAFGPTDRPGRVALSVRDFARFGLLYLRQGHWQNSQLISRKHALMTVTSPLSNTISRTDGIAAEMIPGQRSLGSERIPDNQTDHFGSYSWLWWINGVDRHGTRMFPDVPVDTYGASGHGGPRAMWVIPSLDIVVSYNDAELRGWTSGRQNPTNQALKMLVDATTMIPTVRSQ